MIKLTFGWNVNILGVAPRPSEQHGIQQFRVAPRRHCTALIFVFYIKHKMQNFLIALEFWTNRDIDTMTMGADKPNSHHGVLL